MPEKTHYPQALNGDRLGAHLASEHVCVRNRTGHTDHITLQYCNHYKPDYLPAIFTGILTTNTTN